MTKKKLIEKLKDFPDNTEIIMSIDPEGNGFDILSDVTEQFYNKIDREIAEDRKSGYGQRVICLWP